MLFSKNRVLVPIDWSEESFKVQQLTLEFVEKPSNLYVLYVLPNLNAGEPGVIWDAIDDDTRKEYVKKQFFERFNSPEYQSINFSVGVGEPASQIIDFAQENAIELIVIPSHGRTGLSRFFLGSVAEKVIRFAHCPVLVLRRDTLKK
jgi:nucleotide-binding universal stress UspA family protein